MVPVTGKWHLFLPYSVKSDISLFSFQTNRVVTLQWPNKKYGFGEIVKARWFAATYKLAYNSFEDMLNCEILITAPKNKSRVFIEYVSDSITRRYLILSSRLISWEMPRFSNSDVASLHRNCKEAF